MYITSLTLFLIQFGYVPKMPAYLNCICIYGPTGTQYKITVPESLKNIHINNNTIYNIIIDLN